MEAAAIIISLASATISLGSMGVALLTYRKDKAKLKVEPGYSISIHEPPELMITVKNLGHRPTTITHVGFRVENDLQIRLPEKGGKLSEGVITAEHNINLNQNLIPLGAGEVKKFVLVLNKWPDLFTQADAPLRPFAEAADGSRTWNRSEPILRYMLKQGWKPTGIHPEILKPVNKPIKSKPIYARWKVWHPDYLRKAMLPRH